MFWSDLSVLYNRCLTIATNGGAQRDCPCAVRSSPFPSALSKCGGGRCSWEVCFFCVAHPFQDTEDISVLWELAGKVLTCIVSLHLSKPCRKKENTKNLCHVLQLRGCRGCCSCFQSIWVPAGPADVQLCLWRETWSVRDWCACFWTGCPASPHCRLWGGCGAGMALPARSWGHVFPGPSASGTAGCETLMNFNLGLRGRETDGMTQLETQWIAYWLPVMWFGIFQRYHFPVFIILNECPLLCSASGASVQLPGCCVRLPWCFRAALLIHCCFVAVSLAEITAERSFLRLWGAFPPPPTPQICYSNAAPGSALLEMTA